MRILVTGGAGYIGSHVAKSLAMSGHEPVVLDDLSAGHRWAVRWGPLIEDDLSNVARLTSILKRHEIKAVFHLAANAYVGESVNHPRKYYRNNVVHTLNLLDAMLNVGVTRLVLSSSCATYGYPDVLPIAEGHPQLPSNPYGETKLAVERLLHWYDQAYALQSVVLRFFNAAGADSDLELGEVHTPETHLIPLIIQAALGQRSAVQILGTDYPTPDGTAIRDYVHVTDLADAHVQALTYLQSGAPSVALNLGTGAGFSVQEVIAAVERESGCPVVYTEMPRRVGDPPVLIADAWRAHEVLRWQPRHSGLSNIVSTAWRWHSRRSRLEADLNHASIGSRMERAVE